MPKFLDKVENTLNGYVADAKNIKGTYVVVENYSDLANLPKSTVVSGTLVYVVNSSEDDDVSHEQGFYQCHINTDDVIDWQRIELGASQPTLPERFSIAYNLVVNINQQQFADGSWTGTNNSDIRVFQYNGSDADEDKAKELIEFLTGVNVLDVYNAEKPTPCFVFTKQANICWKLQWGDNKLKAYKVNNFPFALKDDVNPIIDVSELPTSSINQNKFYRTTKVGEHIKRGVPIDGRTPIANIVFNTTLSVPEVMGIISNTNKIHYAEQTQTLSGIEINFYVYGITHNDYDFTHSYYITYVPESFGAPFGFISDFNFLVALQGGEPNGIPEVLWCSNGTILSQFTGGLMSFTGWNPNSTLPKNLIYYRNDSAYYNTLVSNNNLMDLVWCSEFDSYKEITKVYENGNSESPNVNICDSFFTNVYSTDLVLFDSNNIPDTLSIYTGIINGTIPYQINDDGDGNKSITALFAPITSDETYEPYTGSTLYVYIATLDISGTPSIQSQTFADAQTIFSYLMNEQLGVFTIDTKLKNETALYHYKKDWHQVGLLPTITIASGQMIDDYYVLLTQEQANYIEDDTISMFYLLFQYGLEGYLYKINRTTFILQTIVNVSYRINNYVFKYDPATKIFSFVSFESSVRLGEFQVGFDGTITLTYTDNNGEYATVSTNDKFLVATQEQTFTSEEKAQLWANLGLENLDEEDF